MYCVYRIINKINGHTYIGQHKYKDLSTDGYMGSGKYLWNAYNKYGIENFEREIVVSEIETREEIDELERKYIKLEREAGHSEYNIKDGGIGGWLMNEEIRRKLSETKKGENNPWYGKHFSEEHREKLSEAHKGKHFSEEARNKISESLKGKHHSEETRNKISESHKGKHLSEETKKRMSESRKGENNPWYGKHHSEETRKKLSEFFKGKPLSEETKNKLSEARKGENNSFYGKHHTEETLRKMSESHKGSIFIHKDNVEKHIRKDSLKLYLNNEWNLGRLKRGKKFYNNGIECHKYIPGTEPEGYILGKLSRDKEDKNDLVWKSVQI